MEFQEVMATIQQEGGRLEALPPITLWTEKKRLHNKVNAKELVKLPTTEFVEALYLEVTGRPGDPSGKEHFRHLIEDGVFTKEALIVEIRKSPEGMAYEAHIRGISHSYWRQKLAWKKAELYNRLRQIKHILHMR